MLPRYHLPVKFLNDGKMRRTLMAALASVLIFVASGCALEPPREPSGAPHPSAPTLTPKSEPSPRSTLAPLAGPVKPSGTPAILVSGLSAPWSVVRLANGSAFISERDSGQIIEYSSAGDTRVLTTVPGVAHGGEGGLLGLAVLESGAQSFLYAYFTAASDNRIVRMPLRGSPGSYQVGKPELILSGVAKARNHNGGRIGFGPDGKLFAAVGDAGQPKLAQDMESLNGKLLRMNPDGSVPSDNPFAGSLIYSLGHRNPQGLAWDSSGQLWAAEFGQNTWDEFNRIEPGKNYGWPIIEGRGQSAGFVDPVLQWSTAEASPSGLAFVRDTFFLAALRGQRVWAIYLEGTARSTAWFAGKYGRLRDAVPGPNGSVWILTNNTDGRGSARAGDDKLLHVTLVPGE